MLPFDFKLANLIMRRPASRPYLTRGGGLKTIFRTQNFRLIVNLISFGITKPTQNCQDDDDDLSPPPGPKAAQGGANLSLRAHSPGGQYRTECIVRCRPTGVEPCDGPISSMVRVPDSDESAGAPWHCIESAGAPWHCIESTPHGPDGRKPLPSRA
jgi:hypothetical protein